MVSGVEIKLTPRRQLLVTYTSSFAELVVEKVGPENSDLFLLFSQAYCSLLLDSPVDSEKPLRVIRKFFRELIECDLKSLILRYASLAEAILETSSTTSDYTITGEFLEEMQDTPIFREYLHFYRTGDTRCLQYILSFLLFGKKMDFVNPDLQPAALRDWLQIERELESLHIPLTILEALKTIVHQLIPRVDDSSLFPKHGPGYTSEGFIDPNDKLDNLSLDAKTRYVFRRNSFGRSYVDRISLDPWLDHVEREQVAKLRFVPKNIKTMRSICMEPISRMFLQQECARWVIDAIGTGPLRSIVDLRDQSRNRHYALHGSYSQSCDTIDLSAASDRISIDLIKYVFPRQVLFYLLGTRTSQVDIGAGVVTLNKFAPMGSALCFPIQCIVFSAITLLGYLMQYYKCTSVESLSKDWYYLHHIDSFVKMMHSKPEEILNLLAPRVYGDDIISDFRTTDNILILLEHCGLRVNTQKCFLGGSPFRESCGIYAYLGEDVTPLLFRIPTHNGPIDANTFASLVAQINRAGDFGYQHLRSTLIHYLRSRKLQGIKGEISPYLPFVESREEFGIYTINKKKPLVTRYNPDYQREEEKVVRMVPVRSRRKPSVYSEWYAYDQWMRARIRGVSDAINFASPRVRPQSMRVKLGWTPI